MQGSEECTAPKGNKNCSITRDKSSFKCDHCKKKRHFLGNVPSRRRYPHHNSLIACVCFQALVIIYCDLW